MQMTLDIPAWLAALIFLVVAAFVWSCCVIVVEDNNGEG